VKLKGIDGGPHKRWSMWFNSKQREEPYQGLTWSRRYERSYFILRYTAHTGAAWLSSARVVRCWVKSRNERNPRPQLTADNAGPSGETAEDNSEEGEDDVKSSWPLRPGLHTCYNGRYRGSQCRKVELIPKAGLSSDCSLQLDCMKLESLVIVGQHTTVNTFPGLVHTARQATEVESAQSRNANLRELAPKARSMTGAKS
jgi:hypothetical protein